MKRLKDWDIRLMKFAQNQLCEPFVWGQTNCVALVARALDSMYGTTLHADNAADYETELRAAKLSLKRETRRRLIALGAQPVDPNFVQRGDIVIGFEYPYECTHVVLGQTALTSTPELGVFTTRTTALLSCGTELEVFRCPQ